MMIAGKNKMSIPVEMIDFVIKNRIYKSFQLYLYLKIISSGKIKLTKDIIFDCSKFLNVSTKSIKRYLDNLLKLNWVGYNQYSGYYFIRGFDALRNLRGSYARTAAIFDIKDIIKIKEFLIAVKIKGFLKLQQERCKEAAFSRGSDIYANQPQRSFPVYLPISCSVIAKIIKISVSTASKYRNFTAKAGFIKIRKDFKDTGFNSKYIKLYKSANPELSNKVRIIDDKILIQKPDLIFCDLKFTKRKKIIAN